MSLLQDFRNIWRAAVQRDPRAMTVMYVLGMLLLVAGLLVAIVGILREKPHTWALLARILAGLAGFWSALLWTMLLVPGMVMLNSPVNARLLPRQRRRLLQAAIGSWSLITAVLTVAVGEWQYFPVVGTFLLAFGLMLSGNRHAAGLTVFIGNWSWLSKHVLPPALVDALSGNAAMAALALALVPIGVWALRWLFPAGGDAHFALRGAHVKQMTRFKEGYRGRAFEDGALPRLYAAALRRDCHSGRGRPDPGRLLAHALGPSVHWSAWVVTLAIMLAVGAAVHLLLVWRGGMSLHDFVHGAALPMLGGMTLTLLFSTAQLNQAINRTRGEQALLRLAPLAGDSALLNRRLARRMLQGALWLWAALSAVILAVTVLVGGTGPLAGEFALCCLAGQVSMMGLLGDYAGEGGWHIGRAWRAAGLAALQVLAAFGLGWLSGTPWWAWMAAIALGVAVVQVRRSWGEMLAAPVAFPARRMG